MSEKRGRMPYPAAVADLLRTAFQGTPAEKILREGKIWLVWNDVVGSQIAARAHPVRFSGGVLTVAVAAAPWMQQLNFLKKPLVEKLNAALGEKLVADIVLKAGRAAALPPEESAYTPPRRDLPPETLEEIDRQTAEITDPELRNAFARLLARHLSAPADDQPPPRCMILQTVHSKR